MKAQLLFIIISLLIISSNTTIITPITANDYCNSGSTTDLQFAQRSSGGSLPLLVFDVISTYRDLDTGDSV
jgi:hypothetical protein